MDVVAHTKHGDIALYNQNGSRIASAWVNPRSWRGSTGESAAIWSVHVDEGHRNLNVGELLMIEAVLYAAKREKLVWLNVYRDNAPARALYRKIGFTEMSEIGSPIDCELAIDDDVLSRLRRRRRQIREDLKAVA